LTCDVDRTPQVNRGVDECIRDCVLGRHYRRADGIPDRAFGATARPGEIGRLNLRWANPVRGRRREQDVRFGALMKISRSLAFPTSGLPSPCNQTGQVGLATYRAGRGIEPKVKLLIVGAMHSMIECCPSFYVTAPQETQSRVNRSGARQGAQGPTNRCHRERAVDCGCGRRDGARLSLRGVREGCC
jgi:hypothetical protein